MGRRGSFQMTGIGRAEGMVFKKRCVEITVQCLGRVKGSSTSQNTEVVPSK